MASKSKDPVLVPVNYLTKLVKPPIGEEHMYDMSKQPKSDFSYVKGLESHLVRRKMILKDHPEISKLQVPEKPWTILIALGVIFLSMLNCYWGKVIIS